MKRLEADYVLSVANTIWTQLKGTTDVSVILSWGIHNLRPTQILVLVDSIEYFMAALAFDVNGFKYKGTILIAYDEGRDYYRIISQDEKGKQKQQMEDVCFDELGERLDAIIEKGNMSEDEYKELIRRTYLIG